MKQFSLLSKLATEQPTPKLVESTSQENPSITTSPDSKEYLVYVMEHDSVVRQIGVPLDKVDAFDAYIAEHPEFLSEIDAHLEEFGALVI